MPTRAQRKEIEGRLRAATLLAKLPSTADARSIRSSLSSLLSSHRMPRERDARHDDFIGKNLSLAGFAKDERGRFLVWCRAVSEPGRKRPKFSWAELAGNLNITERHAKRLYAESLDQIIERLDRESRL